MKIGYKIFLMSFTLTIIAINFTGIKVINNSTKTEIDAKIEEGIVAVNNLLNAASLYQNNISKLANNYYANGTKTKIYYRDDTIYTNTQFDENIEYDLLDNISETDIRVIIKDQNIYMAGRQNTLIVMTTTDIAGIYKNRDAQIKYFIKVSLTCSFVVALALSIFIALITRKMKKLVSSAEEIEKGNYDVTIPNLGSDEIGKFASSFKNMTSAIKDNIDEMNRISENRRIFIGNLTHEIKTPLTSIIGYSSLIKEKKAQNYETIIDYSKKIYDEGKYIENMRDKLMGIMRLDIDSFDFENKNIKLELQKLIKDYKKIDENTKFILNLDDVFVPIDEDLFKSMILNFIKNSASSSTNPTITITLTKKYLSIKDDGKGIPPEELKKIEEPFYTLNKDRNRKTSGLGLGIPLALKIAEIHKFKVDIASTMGVGTIITIHWRNK